MAAKGRRGRKMPPRARPKALVPAKSGNSGAALLKQQLAEARAQQTATAEVLRVISSSPTDTQPVFDAIARSCQRLFNGQSVALALVAGGQIVPKAGVDDAGKPIDAGVLPPWPLDRGSATGASVLDNRSISLADLARVDKDFPRMKDLALRLGYRSGLWVPLRREGGAIGSISILRRATGAFTEQEVALAQTFADQAVIAIENVRLFNETKEALAEQQASGAVLAAIAGSMSDTAPVFERILEACERLFAGHYAGINVVGEDGLVHLAGYRGPNREALERVFPVPNSPESATGVAIAKGKVVHYPDTEAPDVPDSVRIGGRGAGVRSLIMAPMLAEEGGIGTVYVGRRDPMPFSEREIARLEAFASQATIAVKNARLFNETKGALERQTATAEILKVISESPTDVQPVFDAIVRSASRIFQCNAGINVVEGGWVHFKAIAGPDATAARVAKMRKFFPVRDDPDIGFTAAVLRSGAIREIPDTEAADVPERVRAIARAGEYRSLLLAPMVREGRGIGTLGLTNWKLGFRLDAKQKDLLQIFADQAVIAIENVRLFNETNEALEHQTAAAEVLQVISSSVADTAPVFEKIIRSCEKLFGVRWANVGLVREDGMIHLVQDFGSDDLHDEEIAVRKHVQAQFPRPVRESIHGYAMHKGEVLHYADVLNGADVPPGLREYSRRAAEEIGTPRNNSAMFAPMIWEGRGIGAIAVHRSPPSPFSEREIRLLKTFADQATIAIQNARLFNETKEALERQTATADVLKVISESPTDTQPVFDAIAESAARLCEAADCSIFRREEDRLLPVAHHGPLSPPEQIGAFHILIRRESVAGQSVLDRRTIHVTDIQAAADEFPSTAEATRPMGFRTMLNVPLMREGLAIGVIQLPRAEVRPFSDRQIALLETFADQAVIAIENVRLFNETKEALDRQTATAEILKVISESPTDVQPVLDAIVESAAQLFNARVGISIREGDWIDLKAVALMDVAPEVKEQRFTEMKRLFPMPFDPERSIQARVIATLEPAECADTEAEGVPELAREMARRGGYRGYYTVPLVRENTGIGVLAIAFAQPGIRFDDKEKALLRTFADQAVIAIENVRLFNETKEALERQTATAEILKVISESPTDVQPVFDAITRATSRLFRSRASITVREGDATELKAIAAVDLSPDELDRVFAALKPMFLVPWDPERSVNAKIMTTLEAQECEDTEAEGVPAVVRDGGRLGGYRSFYSVPLIREGAGIGVLGIGFARPGIRLDDKQKALARTFADQAVIAIENVRLFKELQARTEALTQSVGQLTALGEVSQVLSSTLDLEKVLATIVSRAVQLTGLDGGAIFEYDEAQGIFLLRGGENLHEEVIELNRTQPIRMGVGAIGTAAAERRPVQVPELREADARARGRDVLLAIGFRALLAVPLVREGHVLGALAVVRNAPGTFPPEVIALLETFATQSAIAIQNARLFREIEEKSRALEVASEHKSQFLASMSHELRTPLNAILGLNEMVLGEVYGEVPEDMKPPLAQTQASGKHLLGLINNVLDLAKIEANRMELALSDFVVQDLIASARATLSPLAAEKGLEFTASAPDDLPLAYGDPGRLAQCLINLAGNALKFTKEGSVRIAVEGAGEGLRFSVADTGIGIPPEKIDELFTEFKQTDATIAREYGGTGLGLAITKRFVELHGGRIWVESAPGRGSTFLFEIPLRAQPS